MYRNTGDEKLPNTGSLSGVSIQRNARNAMNATNVRIASSSQ